MNRFSKTNIWQRIYQKLPLSLILFALIMCGFFYGINSIAGSSVMNEKALLEDALKRNIIHCYSVEGTYPPSLSYMEEHYGLMYDKNKYIINYQNVGSNIMPNVIVIER